MGTSTLIYCFLKVETYEVAPGRDSVHGYTGPLKVSYGGAFTNIGKDFLEVGPKYDTKRGTTDVGLTPLWIMARTPLPESEQTHVLLLE